jgi:hypothetical protein
MKCGLQLIILKTRWLVPCDEYRARGEVPEIGDRLCQGFREHAVWSR